MPIKLHDLRPAPGAKTAKTRVGRGEGGKGGKTAGRGTKGTGARKNVPAGFEGGQMPLHMRLPKLKGFRNRFRVEYQVVNVGDLARLFPDGGEVGPAELVAAGAVRAEEAGQGARQRRPRGVTLTVSAHAFSGSARDKITAAGRLGHRAVDPRHARVRRPARRAGVRSVDGRAPSLLPSRRSGRRLRRPAGVAPVSAGLGSARPGQYRRKSVLSAFRSALTTPDLRKKILFTLAHGRGLPAGCRHPGARGVVPQRPGVHPAGRGRRELQRLLADQPVLRRRAAAAVDLRAGHHALHHGQHHRPAAHRGHPAVRAAEEGRAVGSEQADPVHPLPDDRAGDPAVHRHRRAGRPRPAVRQLHPAGRSPTPASSRCRSSSS